MYYEFREAHREELEACFALREACYRPRVLNDFVDSPEFRQYDDHARHFGLFRQEDSESQLAGYVRIVEAVPDKPRLPLLSYCKDASGRMDRVLQLLLEKHGMVVEGGRLSVTGSTGEPRLALHVACSLTAVYGAGYSIPSFLVAAKHHQRFYESIGFRQVLPKIEIQAPWKSPTRSICMLRSPEMHHSSDARLMRMADAYARFGAIALHPSDPDCFVPERVDPRALQSTSRLALIAAA